MAKKSVAQPTPAEVLEAHKTALEAEILTACNAFEAKTGLLVAYVRHPRDERHGDCLPQRELKPEERVDTGVLTRFPFWRHR
jgi:hypothetical protein